jgi:hypothetical protein
VASFNKGIAMKVDEEVLRTILRAAMRLERPTTEAIAKATGFCESCIEEYLQVAALLGLAERV